MPPARPSATETRAPTGTASSGGVSLLGGVVTAGSIDARRPRRRARAPATGTFGGARERPRRRRRRHLAAAGRAVRDPGHRLGRGQQAPRGALGGAYRGSEVALHIHLTRRLARPPAGTEILLGYADAAAAPPAGAPPAPGAASAPIATAALARGGPASSDPLELGAPVVPLPPGDGTPTDSGDGVTPTGIEAPPPGGFTPTPPVDPTRQEQLISPELRVPRCRRRALRPRFRQPAADTGFHQGSDLFAPEGTPLVAVQPACCTTSAGTGSAAGGCGSRTRRQLVLLRAPLGLCADRQGRRARQRGRRGGLRRHTGDAISAALAPALRDPPGGQWAVPPYDYLQAWQGHRNPFAAIRPSRRPWPAPSSGRPTSPPPRPRHRAVVSPPPAARPVDNALVALGVPAPTRRAAGRGARRHDARDSPRTCSRRSARPPTARGS